MISISDVKKILKFLKIDIDIDDIQIEPYSTSIFFYTQYKEFIFEYFQDGTYAYIITDRGWPIHKIPIWKILNGTGDENEYL